MSFEVRWAMTGESIVLQLVSKLENGQFMAFGLSGSGDSSLMTGADLTVAWMNQHSGQGRAYDYTVSSDAAQCVSSRGICKDTAMKGGKNNIRLLNSAFINGFSMLTFQRPLESPDRWDRNISSTQMQPIVWAIGDMTPESEVAEFTKLVQSDTFVNFGRTPLWNCPVTSMNTAQDDVKETLPKEMSENPSRLSKPDVKPWQIPPIPCHEPEDGVYYVQMGPAGGQQGLQAITSWPGWGMAWYINGLLIPEVNVVRGRTYTFVVEGGANPDTPAKYHPFYITDDPEGGYQFKTDEEKLGIRILAGVGLDSSGQAIPTATGRLCQWRKDSDVSTEDIGSFGAFQRTLKLECEPGQPGILQWTPDESTPDTVYYQCFTHRYLGWKIHVHDECTEEKANLNAFHDVNQTFQGDDADYDYYYDNIAEASFQKEQQYLPNNNPKSDTIEEQMNTHSLPPSSDSTHDLPDYLDYSYPEKLINRLQSAEKYSDSSAIDGNLGSKPASGFNFDQYLVSRKGLLTNSESLQADASAEENHRTIDHEQDTKIERVDNPSDVKKVPTRTSSSRRKTLLQASRRITNRNRPDNLITRRRRPQSQSNSGTSLGSAVGQATDIKKLNSALEDKSQIIKEESTTDEIAKQSIDRLYSKSDFDPQEITFETGFKPVRPVGHNNPGLAFEVEDVQVGSTAHFLDQPPTFSNKGQSIIQSSINRAKQPPQAMKIPLPVSLVPAAPAFSSQNERPLVDTGNTAPNSHHTAQTEDVEYTVELGPIPPPPHLTEEILANAIVFSPDQLPSNFQPVDSGLPQYWNKPQQHVSKGPSKGPLSFFQNLLSYIPGWGPSKPARRHFQKYPAYNQRNPNRALNVLPSRPDRRRRPVNGHYLSSLVYTNSQRINQAQFNRFQKENGEYNLPSKPRLESVIRKTNFQPSAIDSGSFSPLADVQEHSVSKKSGEGPSETFEMKRKLMDDASL